MTAASANHAERLRELLIDRALDGLDHAETLELAGLARRIPEAAPAVELFSEFDHAAACVDAVGCGVGVTIPASLRLSLERLADRFVMDELDSARAAMATSPSAPERPRGASVEPNSLRLPTTKDNRSARWAWVAAAAGLALAGWVWFGRSVGTGPQAAERALASVGDVVHVSWKPWEMEGQPPERSGVEGEVVWSDTAQTGVMRFRGLAANNPAETQYQLWIIDATRGMQQRISGGVFDGRSGGDVEIPIRPQLHVNKAAAFAVTIEQPGGTWVSDMKRRVVIAALP